MIEQGRKGRFERMMFYALGHQVDSFVGDQNRPKKSPLDIPRRAAAAAGLSYGSSGASALIATDSPAAQHQQGNNLQKGCCTNCSEARFTIRALKKSG